MLSTSGNPLNTNNSTNSSNVNSSNSTGAQSTNKTNILNASSLINSEFMLPINNLTLNNNPMATTSSYLNDYNKLYRDVGIFQQQQSKQQQQQQQNNLIGNNNLNNLVVNSLTSNLNNLGNHHQATNNLLNNLPTRHNLNGLPNHNLNNLQQQQQSINNQPTPSKQQLMNNSEFMMRLNRCNACLEANIFETALDEINHAINLVNNSALARFRKAQALLGLKRFFDCEKELWICINLEPNVIDYRKELLKVRQLAIMHFNPNLDQNMALIAAQKYDSIKDACESLMWTAPNGLIDFNSFQTGNNAGQVTGNLTTQPNVNNQQQQQQTNASNNLNENNLLSGWNLNLNATDANNRLINFNALSNQLVNNSNMLFSNNGNNLITNNLLLSNSNMINRSNNGTNGTNNLTTNTSTNTGLGGVNQQQQQQQLKNQQTATSTNSTVTSNNQHSSPNQAASNSPLTNNEATLTTNGLSNLPNGNNRFNYLLRGLDQTTASHLLSNQQQQQQSTNGQANSNNNQNLINNQQQQLYNRIIPSFMDNQNDPTNKQQQQQQQQQQHNLTATSGGINNQAVLNCSRNLQSKLNLNDNSLINGTNGLLIMNNNLNNSAPSPICAKINSAAPSNTSNNASNSNSNNSTNLTSSNNLTNSCNYNIFNQMPEMKLIETIVPNLLNLNNASTLNSNTTGLTNNNLDNQADLTTDSRKLLASIAKEVNNNIGKDGNNLVTNLVDNFTSAVSNSIVNLQTQQSIKQLHQQQQQQQEDDCNKSANKKSTIGKLDLINDLNADKGGVIDLKSSNNSVSKDDLFSNAKELNNQNSPNNLSTNSSGNLASATSAAVSSSQCTSYSDIVKRAKKITQTISTSSNGSNGSTDLSNGTGSKPSNLNSTNKQDNEQNLDDSISSKRPTNLWAYNGLRVANVSLTASKQSLMNLFSKFGRIRLLERIINKTTTNNIWVYFDNPTSPVDAVTKLQNVYIEGICVDSESPLRLFFAPTDDQRDLKFSRPKQPPDNKVLLLENYKLFLKGSVSVAAHSSQQEHRCSSLDAFVNTAGC